MIKIATKADLEKISDPTILPYLTDLVNHIFCEYNLSPDASIEEIGAVFVLEQESDWELYKDMGLSLPIKESRFEWIENVAPGYCGGIVLINNEKCVNILGKQEYFEKLRKETQL